MATGMPFSSRPSLVTTQTCLLLVSGPLPQTFIHGEYISCGWSPPAAAAPAGAEPAPAAATWPGPAWWREPWWPAPCWASDGRHGQQGHSHCARDSQTGGQRPTQRPSRSDPMIHCKYSFVIEPSRAIGNDPDGSLKVKYGGSVARLDLPDSRYRSCNKATNVPKLRESAFAGAACVKFPPVTGDESHHSFAPHSRPAPRRRDALRARRAAPSCAARSALRCWSPALAAAPRPTPQVPSTPSPCTARRPGGRTSNIRPIPIPRRPKAAQLTQGIVGTFDSLNPFIVKGLPAASTRGYVIESLLARGYDEPFTLYGLLADCVETDEARSLRHLHHQSGGALCRRQTGDAGRRDLFLAIAARQGPAQLPHLLHQGDQGRR